ncbi:MAG: hypothetical protein R3E67_00560 [Pseudomonadales bacterium]
MDADRVYGFCGGGCGAVGEKNMNPASYFKEYRQVLGFSNQSEAKEFLSGKDVKPNIDYKYIDALNSRVEDIISSINTAAHDSVKLRDIDAFAKKNIYWPFGVIREARLLPRLNNQGRRPEEVLFSWLRGYAISEYFTPAFSEIFEVPLASISNIGDDDLRNIETFKRSPKADLEIKIGRKIVRVEVQSGFQGINDIKEHKVRESRRVFEEKGICTICIHVDVYNGQVAFVRLDHVEENDVHFVTRQQMEGQSVFQIDQNYFKWRLLDKVPNLNELELGF